MPTVGKPAPDFELINQDGKTVRLSDFRGKKVVMFAYPAAGTSGCTTQACGFRDQFPRFQQNNIVILGISPDTPADHDYEGGFAAALMVKDIKLAMEAAKAAGAYTPMGGEAEELFQRFVDRGGASKDFSGIIKMIDDSWSPPKENQE